MKTTLKTLATLVAMLTAGLSANAQDVKMRSVGNVEMVVSYALDQLCDYPNQHRDFDWRIESPVVLEVGEGKAHSYVVNEMKDCINSFKEFRSQSTWRLGFNIHALVGETFVGFPKSGQLTQIVNLDAAGIYRYFRGKAPNTDRGRTILWS